MPANRRQTAAAVSITRWTLAGDSRTDLDIRIPQDPDHPGDPRIVGRGGAGDDSAQYAIAADIAAMLGAAEPIARVAGGPFGNSWRIRLHPATPTFTRAELRTIARALELSEIVGQAARACAQDANAVGMLRRRVQKMAETAPEPADEPIPGPRHA